jgi:hypothetical protein
MCGRAHIRLEFGGERDQLCAVAVKGLDNTVDSHGARLTGA